LYKLLLYEEGAFFKPHQDSEKTPGMFGTLVICLPSPHQGGEVVLSHGHRTKTFETSPNSELGMSFAAWYSDVLHEVKPVTSGYRLVLTYNLVVRPGASILAPPSLPNYKHRLVTALNQYDTSIQSNLVNFPSFLVHKFEYQYTQASLRAERLQGADLAQMLLLKDSAAGLDFNLYLATMEKTIVRNEEHQNDYRRRFKEYYDEEEEDNTYRKKVGMGKVNKASRYVISHNLTLTHVVTLEGARIDDPTKSGREMYINENALLFQDEDEREPDEEEHSGYTGNEGVTGTYWYRDTVRQAFSTFCSFSPNLRL